MFPILGSNQYQTIMAKFTTLSQAEFSKQSELAKSRQPLRKEISLKDVEIVSEDILKVQGHMVPMTNDAFKQFSKIVGLPVGFDKSFTDKFGTKARQKLMNRLKTATAAKGAASISLVVSPEDRKIVGVNKENQNLISNSSFLKSTEQIIDKYGLEVNDFTTKSDGTVTINTSSPSNHWGIKGLKDEDFFGGVTFSNGPENGFEISPFLHRLVCANGMIGKAFDERFSVKSFSNHEMEQLFQQLNHLAERGFRPASFEEKVQRAINTPASLMEMSKAHELLRSSAGVNIEKMLSLEEWVPYHTTRQKYHDFGVDTIMLSNDQRKNAKTGTSVWELINGITHFATHENDGFKLEESERRNLQIHAGNLLSKNAYDMQNLVTSPF